jgi:hypothetical protein
VLGKQGVARGQVFGVLLARLPGVDIGRARSLARRGGARPGRGARPVASAVCAGRAGALARIPGGVCTREEARERENRAAAAIGVRGGG